MASISAKEVADLRTRTGAGMMDCKKALEETGGNMEKAIEYLRAKGSAKADTRAGRKASEGVIGSYIHHNGKIAVLVELNCETDFVAKTEAFERLAKDIAMHISFADPDWTTRDQVPQGVIDEESAIYAKQAMDSGKPENIIEKIVGGKLEGFYKERVLMDQEWIQDKSKSISDLVSEAKASMGENINIGRFARIRVGEGQGS